MRTVFKWIAVVAWTAVGLELVITFSRAIWSAYRTYLSVNGGM